MSGDAVVFKRKVQNSPKYSKINKFQSDEKITLNRELTTTSTFLIVLLLVTICIFGLTSARNMMLWFVQNSWSAAGEYFNNKWDRIVDLLGHNHILLWIIVPNIISTIVYWSFGGIYVFMDFYNIPKFLRKYKTQPGFNEPLDREKFIKAAKTVVFNQIVVGFSVSGIMYFVMKKQGFAPIQPLPSLPTILLHIAVCSFMQEFAFYYCHRLLHHRLIYKYLHKKHHEWTAPISIVSEYSHPLEHAFSNLFPAIVGLSLMNSHVFTTWIWLILVNVVTVNDHSGYHIPFLTTPEFHDYHHYKFNQCFGSFGLMDWLHNTSTMYEESQQSKRDIRLFSLKSAREMFPDNEPNIDNNNNNNFTKTKNLN